MERIAFKGRLLLRKVLTWLSLGAVSFVFAACYGMPMEEPEAPYVSIRGKVRSSDTEQPIPGIRVSAQDGYYYYCFTDSDGAFDFRALKTPDWTASLLILFQDIDGPENGWFEDKAVRWNSKYLNVTLDCKADGE